MIGIYGLMSYAVGRRAPAPPIPPPRCEMTRSCLEAVRRR